MSDNVIRSHKLCRSDSCYHTVEAQASQDTQSALKPFIMNKCNYVRPRIHAIVTLIGFVLNGLLMRLVISLSITRVPIIALDQSSLLI